MKSARFELSFAGMPCIVDENDLIHWNGKTFPVKEAAGALRYGVEQERLKVLGIPDKVLKFYRNERFLDAYTVMFTDRSHKDGFFCLALEPNGACSEVFDTPGFHLGRRIYFSDLPEACQEEVLAEVEDYYGAK